MSENPQRIQSAQIIPPQGWGCKAKVLARFEDGHEEVVLEYYDDELHFSPEEFKHLTRYQVSDLFHRKDVAYLRS